MFIETNKCNAEYQSSMWDADAGNGVAIAGKQAAAKPAKPGKPSTAAAKRASGKAASKDQRGIMSFFNKK